MLCRITCTKIRKAAATLVRGLLAEEDVTIAAKLMSHKPGTADAYYNRLQHQPPLATMSNLVGMLLRSEEISKEDLAPTDASGTAVLRKKSSVHMDVDTVRCARHSSTALMSF